MYMNEDEEGPGRYLTGGEEAEEDSDEEPMTSEVRHCLLQTSRTDSRHPIPQSDILAISTEAL